MKFIHIITSSLSIVFFTLIVGYYIGRIKIKNISLGLGGVLFVALIAGYAFSFVAPMESTIELDNFVKDMKTYSSLGTALFVSTIGLINGYTFKIHRKSDLSALGIGALMVASAFGLMKAIYYIDEKMSYSKLLGVLCGALTTTPGLSAASELSNVNVEEITLAYGCTYVFGVIAIVLFVQVGSITDDNNYKGNILQKTVSQHATMDGLIQIGVVILLGRLLGSVTVYGFSLGNSGGMLIAGIVIGALIRKIAPHKKVSTDSLTKYKTLGLVLFFCGNGIVAGMSLYNGFDVEIILYGMILTVCPIVIGFILCRCSRNGNNCKEIVSGGMTSTPAISVLEQKRGSVNLTSYSMAYFGALLTTVLLVRL